MKSIRIILLSTVVVVLGFTGCGDLFGGGTSVKQRITSFETALNTADRTDIYKNFHPTATQNYQQIADAQFWEAGPFAYANQPFTITYNETSDVSDLPDGTTRVNAELFNANNSGTTPGYTMTLIMQIADPAALAKDWRIKTLTLPDETPLYEIKKPTAK